VSGWTDVFLGIIAVATLATAIVQVGVLVAAGLLTRRVGRLVDRVERELSPMFASVNAIAQDAARAASLATAQVERVDKLFSDAAIRVDETLKLVQSAVAAPAREGAALLSGLRAAINAIRSGASRSSRGRSADDEDALFI
jgi:hypothetical protein